MQIDDLLEASPSLGAIDENTVVISGPLCGRDLSRFPTPLSLVNCDLTDATLKGCLIRRMENTVLKNTNLSDSLIFRLSELENHPNGVDLSGARDLEHVLGDFRSRRKAERNQRKAERSQREAARVLPQKDRPSSTTYTPPFQRYDEEDYSEHPFQQYADDNGMSLADFMDSLGD